MYGKIKVLQPYLLPYSYSLFEPNSRTLAEYGVRLEKAILRDSELLSEVNTAFCNSHPLLAQKVVTTLQIKKCEGHPFCGVTAGSQ